MKTSRTNVEYFFLMLNILMHRISLLFFFLLYLKYTKPFKIRVNCNEKAKAACFPYFIQSVLCVLMYSDLPFAKKKQVLFLFFHGQEVSINPYEWCSSEGRKKTRKKSLHKRR